MRIWAIPSLDYSFKGLPGGIVHNDLFPDNTFASNDSLIGIIDFSDAAAGPFIFDIAVILNYWIFMKYGEYRKNLVASFINAYQNRRELEAAEIRALPDALNRATLIFLLERFQVFEMGVLSPGERELKDFRELLPMLFAKKELPVQTYKTS